MVGLSRIASRIAIAGSSGLVGTALRESYERDGHEVVGLVRPYPPDALDGADIVINLAGAGIGDRRWSPAYQELIRRSRVEMAARVADLAASSRPAVLLSASGIRYYGIDRGPEVLTEGSGPKAEGLLATTAHEWEAATAPAASAGVRVCHLRLGLVLSRHGGLLPPLATACRWGLGGSFGAGREYWSFVTLADAVSAIRFLAASSGAAGPYNISAPNPVTNREVAAALGAVLRRPAFLRIPMWALRLRLGPMANEVFGSLRVIPRRLIDAGFEFRHPEIESALRGALFDD